MKATTHVSEKSPDGVPGSCLSLLSLYRVQSTNLTYCVAHQSADSLAFKKNRAPFEEEIMELIAELRLATEFYETLSRPERVKGLPVREGYEGQVEETSQRLDELLSRNNNNGVRNRCVFFAHNGSGRLVDCIKIMSQFVTQPELPSKAMQTTVQRLKGLLGLFDTLYVGEVKMSPAVAHDDALFQLLFPLFSLPELFDMVLHALEDLLIARDSIFPLHKIQNFYGIVGRLERTQLGQFSNMIALLIFEHNKEDFTDIFVKKDQLILYPTFKQTTLNQAIVVNTPELFPRLTSLIEYPPILTPDRETIKDLKQNDMLTEILRREEVEELWTETSFNTVVDAERVYTRVIEDGALKHEKQLAKCLSNPRISYTLFNSYLYNTAEVPRFEKTPLIGEGAMKEVLSRKERKAEEGKGEAKEKEKDDGNDNEETKHEPEAEANGDPTYPQYIYLIKINRNQIVEILFVLSTLLSGKRKTELQRRFLRFNFINRLSDLYKQIKWQPFSVPNQAHLQTDAALKIQFLRLIHNLTSRDQWDIQGKLLFVSSEELNTILLYRCSDRKY